MNQDFEALLAVIAKRNVAYADFVAETKQMDEYAELFDVRDVQMWRALGLDITRTAKPNRTKNAAPNDKRSNFLRRRYRNQRRHK